MELSRQEYWSGLPFPILRDLPDPGIELESFAIPASAGRFFTTGRLYICLTDINWDCPRQVVQPWLQRPRDGGDRPVKHSKKCPVGYCSDHLAMLYH